MTPYVIGGAVLAAAISSSYLTGLYYKAEISDMRADKAKLAQLAEKKNREIELLQLELAGQISLKEAESRRKLKLVEREVTKEIIKYVQSPAPKCDLSPDWVYIHDLSASGVPENPSTPAESDVGAREVKDSDALVTITENYSICNETRNQLILLQEWARKINDIQR